ncbi:AGZA family xanthine/uracil permease-like MFS transporter [Isoptericola sp. CG 20/1183]|uniref:AGZA family xanthine/uracil permease-like MFS transporter n=1 Tax=Isoptericola halotolerans TaxID=300560 RepID=A0ABX5EJA1_9MICO|nr:MULTISPECIES: NCS2 family permease [Isoptericola]PRZ08115.1 AGZA family xanthine/uracil permease-like MFS transporter [Isoptericola halotolerans]PRZ08912.1 AGZA family xanthine/uracil permease-like MFS transporter [Isoptericola sp. CG 20/1183]
MANQTSAPVQGSSAIDRFFKITERGSTVGREVRGGLVTFFAMSYIIVLNPLIIGTVPDGTGAFLGGGDAPNLGMVAAATALVAGVVTIAMGVFANFPLALAAGLGLNAVVAYSIASLPDVTWADAMGLVVIEGVIILVLVLTGFREAVFNAVPLELKTAISVGIGLFIALIGFVNAGFVVPGEGTPLALGYLGTWPILVFVVGLLLVIILFVRKVRGAMFIAIATATVLAVILENTLNIGAKQPDGSNPNGFNLNAPTYDGVATVPDFGLLGQFSLLGSFESIAFVTVILLVFSLLIADFFDTMGTMVAVGSEAGLLDAKGNPPKTRAILVVDSLAAVAGGVGSVSSNTAYVESTSGVGDGARTGLASVVTGLAFLAATFLSPLVGLVPYEAAAPALVFVGYLMMMQVASISWKNVEIAIPAFLTIVVMPFTYSIADGIGAGFIAFVVIKLALGKIRQIHWLMWVAAAMFVVYFLLEPLESLIGG